MKSILRSIAFRLRPLLRFVASLFFDKRYLAGRHFEQSLAGYAWAFKSIWIKNILRLSAPRPWPTGLTCHISNPANIVFDPNDLNNFQSPGTYFQNFKATIYIGRGTYIAPNVGIITANHQAGDLDAHAPGKEVVIGEECWIGMNAIILPGVELGPKTVVAAGAVVTKSFPDGNSVIAGVPAQLSKTVS